MWFRNFLRPARGKKAARPGVGTARQVDVRFSAQALRQLERLRLQDSRDLYGEVQGQRRSSRRKPDIYFREHRAYVPGDDLRFVDWRASARQENIFMRQGELEKEAAVYLLLDCSASMAWGAPPKNKAQLELAAALGYLALAGSDRLSIYPFGGHSNQPLGLMRGKGQAAAMMAYLRKLTYGGEVDILAGIRTFARRVSWDGVIFLLSDLFGVERLDATLKLFPAPTWDVHVLHVLHPEELAPTLNGAVQMVDSESGAFANYNVDRQAAIEYGTRLQAWQNTLEMDCIQNHTSYNVIPSDWVLEHETLAHLRSVKLVRAK